MRFTRAAAGLALAAALLATAAAAQPEAPPAPTRWVTDTAGFLSASTRQQLDARLERYQRDTGRQVIVWIGKSISRGELEDFAVRAFEAWGIGKKGKDEGVAIFVFPIGGPGERHIRIEVGYGLEGVLPDAIANQIVEDVMIPRLQAGQPDEAIVAGVSAVLGRLGGETSPPPRIAPIPRTTRPEQPSIGSMILFAILAVGFLILLITNPRLALWLLFSMMSGGRGGGYGGRRGGGFGGGGGGFRGGGGRSGGGGASGSW